MGAHVDYLVPNRSIGFGLKHESVIGRTRSTGPQTCGPGRNDRERRGVAREGARHIGTGYDPTCRCRATGCACIGNPIRRDADSRASIWRASV